MNAGLSSLWGPDPVLCLLGMVRPSSQKLPLAASFLCLCSTQTLCLPLWAPPEASKAAGVWPPAAITPTLGWKRRSDALHPHCLPRKLPSGRRLGCSQTLGLGKGWSPATGQADHSLTAEVMGASPITNGPLSKSTRASRSGSKALHARGRAVWT